MKDIPGFKREYSITKDGKVWSHLTNKFLSKKIDSQGYYSVGIRGVPHRIHRLLGIVFIPNPYNKDTINHINGIKSDNRIENLEWNTQEENNLHARRTGLSKPPKIMRGEDNPSAKLTWEKVDRIRLLRSQGVSYKKIAEEVGISKYSLADIIFNRNWKK